VLYAITLRTQDKRIDKATMEMEPDWPQVPAKLKKLYIHLHVDIQTPARCASIVQHSVVAQHGVAMSHMKGLCKLTQSHNMRCSAA
jgi:hypothetical protein